MILHLLVRMTPKLNEGLFPFKKTELGSRSHGVKRTSFRSSEPLWNSYHDRDLGILAQRAPLSSSDIEPQLAESIVHLFFFETSF